jgi:hypothetical protein
VAVVQRDQLKVTAPSGKTQGCGQQRHHLAPCLHRLRCAHVWSR